MDGLSVAGSVAGIISLGIQVSQSLAEYYEAYKRRESYISATAAKLANLLRLFESLQSQLTSRKFRVTEKSLLDDIEESIRMCEDNIRALEITIRTFNISASNGNRAALQTKVPYPLRESTMRKLDLDIDEIVSYLSLALAVLENGVVNASRNDIEDTQAVLDLVRTTKISPTIRAWLEAPDPTTNYKDACKLRHPRTGLWFVEGFQFSTWLVKPNSFLWLNGFSGCGKSVLCSTAIQYIFRHRRSSPTIGLAFFFFTFNDDSKQDASAMLRALILQLSSQLNGNHTVLTRLYNRYSGGTPPDHDLEDCMHQLVRSFEHVYIILDALDESPLNLHGKNLRKSVLKVLVLMRKWSDPGLHLLVTSRDEPDICRDVLPDDLHAPQTQVVSMKNTSVDRDIASFIYGCLKDRSEMRKWEKYHDQIERALTERSRGIFRWAEYQFMALSCCASKKHLDNALASLPRDLDETYERMLLNIDETYVQDAKRILTLLCCVKRPLTVPELIDATAVELGDKPQWNPDGRLLGEDEIHAVCPGLLDFHVQPDSTTTVRIAHFSVQEYLESERMLQQNAAKFSVRRPEAHAEIASICLTYLLEPALLMDPIEEYPLAAYAAKTWHEHFLEGDKAKYSLEHQALRLFRSSGGQFEKWIRISDFDSHNGNPGSYNDPSPVYYASLLGLDLILTKILCESSSIYRISELSAKERSAFVNARGGRYGSPLQAGAAEGHKQVVALLLNNGADVNAAGGDNGSALQAASTRGHKQVVALLLNNGADVNAAGKEHGSALWLASIGGHEQVVKLLLNNGADVNAAGGRYGSALQAASARGHEQVVKLLLNRGADVNETGGDDHSALQAASAGGHEQIVKLLLNKGAQFNAAGGRYGSALQIASARGHEHVVALLLNKGADVNETGEDDQSALQAASAGGHEQVVKLLLNNGADVNAVSWLNDSALQVASLEGYEQIVKLLLNKGADVHVASGEYGTALQAASGGGHEQIVKLLLRNGADVNAAGGDYGSALQLASDEGYEQIVKLLLTKARVHTQPAESTTPHSMQPQLETKSRL